MKINQPRSPIAQLVKQAVHTLHKTLSVAALICLLFTGSNALASDRFSDLSPEQQKVLAPLKHKWHKLPAKKQQQLARKAARFAKLPPAKQQALRKSQQEYKELSAEEREELRRRWQKDKSHR